MAPGRRTNCHPKSGNYASTLQLHQFARLKKTAPSIVLNQRRADSALPGVLPPAALGGKLTFAAAGTNDGYARLATGVLHRAICCILVACELLSNSSLPSVEDEPNSLSLSLCGCLPGGNHRGS